MDGLEGQKNTKKTIGVVYGVGKKSKETERGREREKKREREREKRVLQTLTQGFSCSAWLGMSPSHKGCAPCDACSRR